MLLSLSAPSGAEKLESFAFHLHYGVHSSLYVSSL